MAVQVKDAGSRQLEKKRFWKEVGRQKVLLIWAAVFVVYGFVFCYLPLAGWLMAFQNYKPKDGLFGSQFVGLAKFQQLFSDDTFLGVIRNTLAMGVLNLVTTFVMAILFAILLNEVRTVWWKKTIQTISYLPHFLSWIIVTGILHDALSSTGIVNELLVNLGIFETELNFFAYPKYFWGIVAFANVWKETGWNAIIYLAAISGIDAEQYEAAEIDGTSKFHQFTQITLPMVSPTLFVVMIMRLMSSLKVFDLVYMMVDDANPALNDAQTLMSLFYRESFIAGDKGYASAIVVWTVLLIGIVTVIQFVGQKKWVNYEV